MGHDGNTVGAARLIFAEPFYNLSGHKAQWYGAAVAVMQTRQALDVIGMQCANRE